MYIFKGQELTEEQITGFAEEKGVDVTTFLANNPEIEVKEQPTTQEDAEIVGVEAVSGTGSTLEDGSLELPKVEETVVEEVKPEEDVEAEGFVGNIVDFFDDIGTAARQCYMQGERTD